jgi:hypothetical protein
MIEGHVESYGPTTISGWALDPERRHTDVFVEIALDDEHVATVRANLRSHCRAGKNCGFAFTLPPALRHGRKRALVSVRATNTERLLGNAPRHLSFDERRTPRVLVLVPAGARYAHDHIRAHERPRLEMIETYTNTGDYTVYDSSLKLLRFSDVTVANMTTFTDKDVDLYNAEFDWCFLRGSNFINETMEWARLPELLKKLRIPVIPFAVGAQAETRRKLAMPEKAKEVWRLFADHCATIGVRGTYSAEVLNDIGVRNVEIIGCPSLFRQNDPWLRIDAKPIEALEKIAFNMRREVSKTYAADIDRYLATQRDFILRLAERFNVTVTAHGEPPEKSFFFKEEPLIAKHMPELLKSGWFDGPNGAMAKLYREKMFFSNVVAEYDTFVRTMDLALGFRVHGNLPALANRVPAVFVEYDQRSSELAETFSIPCLTMNDIASRQLEDFYRPDLWDRFNAGYLDHYRRMRTFLDRNGMAHRLADI